MMVVEMMTVMLDWHFAPSASRLPEDSEQCESLIPLNTVSPNDFCSWANPAQRSTDPLSPQPVCGGPVCV